MITLSAHAQSTSAAAASPSSASSTSAPASAASGPGDRAKRDADVFHWILIHADKPRRPNSSRDERLSATAAARAKPTSNTLIKADDAPLEVPETAKTQTIATIGPNAVPALIATDPAIERTTDKVRVRPALPQPIAPMAQRRSPLIEQASVGPVEPASTMAIIERNVVLSKGGVELPAIDPAEPASVAVVNSATVEAAPAIVPGPMSVPTFAPAHNQPASAALAQDGKDLAAAKPAQAHVQNKASDEPPHSAESSTATREEPADEPGAESLKPLSRADPQFSAAMMRTLRKGKVEVQFTVLPDGSVSEPSVVSTSNARLNAVALAAIAKWRFAPIIKPQLGVVDMVFDVDAE